MRSFNLPVKEIIVVLFIFLEHFHILKYLLLYWHRIEVSVHKKSKHSINAVCIGVHIKWNKLRLSGFLAGNQLYDS